jgi:hypothetical protein
VLISQSRRGPKIRLNPGVSQKWLQATLHEILQNKIPTAPEEADQGSDPEKKQAERGEESYHISDRKHCRK